MKTDAPRTSAKCGKSNALLQPEFLDVDWAGIPQFYYKLFKQRPEHKRISRIT